MSIESIKLIAIDVDGTLTDGNFYTNEAGQIYKNFFTRDISAMYKAKDAGFKVIIITGSTDRVIYAKLGKNFHIISGSKNKFIDLSKYLVEEGLTWDDVAYIGDAENDYKCVLEASLSGCPSDAIPEIVEHSVYPTHAIGGKGAVYEFIRHLFKLKKMEWPLLS